MTNLSLILFYRILVENKEYILYLERLLSALRSSVLHTAVGCQVMVLAGILKALSSLAPHSKIEGMLSLVWFKIISIKCTKISAKEKDTNLTQWAKSLLI